MNKFLTLALFSVFFIICFAVLNDLGTVNPTNKALARAKRTAFSHAFFRGLEGNPIDCYARTFDPNTFYCTIKSDRPIALKCDVTDSKVMCIEQ